MSVEIVYRPWVARPGMAGWLKHLSKAWGDPNRPYNEWPSGLLERVCERGAPIPVTYDRDGRPSAQVLFTHDGILVNGVLAESR